MSLVKEVIKDQTLTWKKVAEILNAKGSRTIHRKIPWTQWTIAKYCKKTYPELAKRSIICRHYVKPVEYQDIDRDEKCCKVCKKVKSYSKDFYFQKKYQDKYYPRPECKECWTEISRNRQNERKIERWPDKYWQCEGDDCFHVNANNLKKCFKCGRFK